MTQKSDEIEIDIFRAGTHTSSSGRTVTITNDDLDKAIINYSDGEHEAPVVIGHPKENAPAFGWVKSITRKGDILKASIKQIPDDFRQAVKDGRYKKVSAAFYDAPNGYGLRHVGFLGAMPPAVKGLGPVSFADSDIEILDFTTADSEGGVIEEIKNLLKEFSEKLSPQPKPTEKEKPVADNPKTESDEKAKTESDEKAKAEALEKREKELKAKEEAHAKKADEFAKQQEKNKEADAKAFAEGLVKAGKMTPAQSEGLVEFMTGLDDEKVLTFSEGKEKSEGPPSQYLKNLLNALPVQIPQGEKAGGTEFSEGNPEEMAHEARKLMDENKHLSSSKAVALVKAGKGKKS